MTKIKVTTIKPIKERRYQEENKKDVSDEAKVINWRWAGHLMRLSHNPWALTVTTWDERR